MDIDSPIIGAYLAGEPTGEEREIVERWRAAHPDNEARFQARARVWDLCGALPPRLVSALVDPGSARAGGSVLPFRRPERVAAGPAPSRWRRLVGSALAAAVLLVAFATTTFERARTAGLAVEDVVTGAGEVATVALRDGTVIRLGPDSRLSFRQDGGQRDVVLDGQAYFAVRHEARVPFRVFTGGGEVKVLGTRFDVQARGAEVRVVVVEGAVEVQAQGQRVNLGPSEMARSDATAGPVVESVADVYDEIAWIGEFIAFGSTPLSAVAHEFEQRFGLRVEIADSVLATRTVTGWFRDQSPVETLASVCFVVNAHCIYTDGLVRIGHPPGALEGAGRGDGS